MNSTSGIPPSSDPQQKEIALLTRDQEAQQSRVNATERLIESAQRKIDREQMAQGLPPFQPQPLDATSPPDDAQHPPSSGDARLAHTRALNDDAQRRLDQTTEALDAATAPTPTPMATN
jgi:hypothetical protein